MTVLQAGNISATGKNTQGIYSAIFSHHAGEWPFFVVFFF